MSPLVPHGNRFQFLFAGYRKTALMVTRGHTVYY
uniref:Uncharacterized protein n=1 Tax=Anguilla anguilla TaxID=7936 RepID=A0A0E9S3A8_ANGAN